MVNNEVLFLKNEIFLSRYVKTKLGEKFLSVKNSEEGRCFIIGNGPSLTASDLSVLHINNIPCFGANRIYSMYKKTDWRAKYYVSQDSQVLDQIYGDLQYAIRNSDKSFFAYNTHRYGPEIINNENSYMYFKRYAKRDNEVSSDLTKGLYGGMTVIFAMMQIAAYLGFTEIYLLGVDHNYNSVNTKAVDKSNHFEGIKEIDPSKLAPANFKAMNKDFEAFKIYANNHGIKIYNATRGGRLEVYPRVDFDSLVNEWSKGQNE